MDRIEKLSRKIDIKEASGMNTDREFAELLTEIAGGKEEILEFDQDKYYSESKHVFAKAFSVIPAVDPETNILTCADLIESEARALKDDDILKWIKMESRFSVIWEFMRLEMHRMVGAMEESEKIMDQDFVEAQKAFTDIFDDTQTDEGIIEYYNRFTGYYPLLLREIRKAVRTDNKPAVNSLIFEVFMLTMKADTIREDYNELHPAE